MKNPDEVRTCCGHTHREHEWVELPGNDILLQCITCNAFCRTRADVRRDVRSILLDPEKSRELAITTAIAAQAREGIETTREEMERAYDRLHPIDP